MVVTWSDLAKHCPWSKGQPIGNGIYCAPWHSASSYPIPPEGEWDLVVVWFHLSYYYYPIPPEGEWDLVVVWFHLSYYYPIPPEGEWDLVVVWFHLSYYYYYRRGSSKGFV